MKLLWACRKQWYQRRVRGVLNSLMCWFGLALLLFFASCKAAYVKDEHGVVSLNPANWDEVVLDPKYDVIVEFYSPYCSYCQELEPVWNELGEKFKSEDSVLITKIDVSLKANTIPGHPVRGVPTIKLFSAQKKDSPVLFHDQRTLNSFIEFIIKNVDHPINVPLTYKSKPIPTETGEAVRELVGLNFKEVVEDNKLDVAVNFYAPWCPWSKRLTPVWEELGEKLKGSPTMIITKFDGTANEVPGLTLHAFPTIALYRSVDNEVRYYRDGVRTVDALTNFLSENAGTEFKNSKDEVVKADPLAIIKDHAVDVQELTDDDYEPSVYDQDANVLVLFYAPWCEHSQEMFATWEQVGLEYKHIDGMKVAQMDANKEKKPEVSIFPTVKLFPAGEKNKEEFPTGLTFKGKELSLKNIVAFVAENARRTPKEQTQKRMQDAGETLPQDNDAEPKLGQTLIIKTRLEL
eukprot:TRINITY_DN6433_c0_g1_i3.p1 TRINITY_DN6433_c0_g1~~TRINITY_DN6433_c0_g1_i3.p1  ORF type:complete len:498 (-),score=89.97 TRINITY_DN6433_c0_g1_i3:168-1553(-)